MHFLPCEVAFQVICHLSCGTIAVLRFFLHGLQANILQFPRHVGIPSPREGWFFLADLTHLLQERFRMERGGTGQKLIEDRAEREHIAPAIKSRAGYRVFGRKIIRRAHDFTWKGDSPVAAFQVSRQPKVKNLWL